MPAVGPDRRGSRHRSVAFAAAGMLLFGVMACTGDDAPEGSVDEVAEDALDLGAAPSSRAVLAPDRGDPPATLQVEDLVEGSGSVVEPGDVLTVEYLGWRWSDGGEFASSWGAGQPLRFELGSGRLIPGWEQGLLGSGQELGPLRVGGRRVLTIPPELAYAERGSGSTIPPDETLVFVIDLVAADAEGDGRDADAPADEMVHEEPESGRPDD